MAKKKPDEALENQDDFLRDEEEVRDERPVQDDGTSFQNREGSYRSPASGEGSEEFIETSNPDELKEVRGHIKGLNGIRYVGVPKKKT